MLGVPARLPRDRVEQERVDLGEGMVAREPTEREGQSRIAARVVERVPRLVEERLVVVEAALRAGDRWTSLGGSVGITQARGAFCGRSSRSGRMPFSASRSKPIARSVERQTGTLRSFVYVASSGESRRIHAM